MKDYVRPPLLLPFFLLLIILPFTLLLLIATPEVFRIVFGVSYERGIELYAMIILGSLINVPVYEREGKVLVERRYIFGVFYYTVTEIRRVVVAVNLGGCVLPTILALKLLAEIPKVPWIVVFTICTAIVYFYAKPVPGLGIVVPMFVPPVISALTSYIVCTSMSIQPIVVPKIAFSAGVLSTLFGADLLHLKDLEKIGSGVVSIGGAGTFDGIFLTGIFSVIFALLLI